MIQEKTIARRKKETNDGCDLYTFIMDFKGGTYVSQVKAKNKDDACIIWARALKIEDIEDFKIVDKQAIAFELTKEEVTPITHNINVWMICLDILGNFSIIHIIKTEKTIER